MKNTDTIQPKWKKPAKTGCFLLLCFICLSAASQVISVTTVQNMSFGAFSQGSSGGSVIIASSGSRTATGNVVPLNLGIQYFQAIFDVEASVNTIVSILNGPDATLTGSNGGTMSLHIGSSDPGSPFINAVAPPGRTQINIGGVLTIGNTASSPPGNYSGTFYITFNNE
ncbi:MAG: hypothetical protein JWM28_1646 [Chitinophagaceae bacterium]|nr:hypothetical protein [Chitinophagaceae bacterium]